MASGMLIKDGSSELRMFMGRARLLFAGALVLTLILVARMLHLQVLQHEHYQTRSEENRMQMVPVPPVRGLIFDRRGNLLAENRPIFNLALIRERIEDFDGFIEALAAVTPISAEEVKDFHDRLKRTRRPFEPVVLKFALTDEEVAALAVNRHRFLGAEINVEIVRHYPYGALAAHAIGSVRRITKEDLEAVDRARYSGTNFIGKRGIERFYEHSLHGEVGTQWMETDAFGRVRRTLDVSPTVVGRNLRLHLDIDLQAVADEALGERRGAVVAIDPNSGGVLALVSKPSYDPNVFVTGIDAKQYSALLGSRDKPLVNRAISGQYAPGSTIKPILGLAGLTHGVVDGEEEI
ncbi:MAG: penicillin-binding transpeptidase domain-containing protein, partial [Gammaproteobacteria bacterium]|nr:penicillin-binding transpeptidase domain-containing protein [Gammaproteobacteria bacterium]